MRRNPEVGKSLQNDRKDNEPGLYPNRNCTRNSHLTEPGPGVGGVGIGSCGQSSGPCRLSGVLAQGSGQGGLSLRVLCERVIRFAPPLPRWASRIAASRFLVGAPEDLLSPAPHARQGSRAVGPAS